MDEHGKFWRCCSRTLDLDLMKPTTTKTLKATTNDSRARYTEAYKALEDVAIHGWGKRDGTRVQTSGGSYEKHDPQSLQRLHLEDDLMDRRTRSINGYLQDREVKVKGCTAPDDCHTVDRACGFLGASGCSLGRR